MTSTTQALIAKLKQLTPLQLFILILVASATIASIKFYGRQPDWRTIKVQVIGRNWTQNYSSHNGYRAPHWLADKINVDDIEKSVNGATTAIVTKVEIFDQTTPEKDMYLTIDILGELNTRTNKYSYKSRVVEVGAPIEFHLNHAHVTGQIIDDNYPQEGYPKKQVVITGRLYNTEPWIIDQFKTGDTASDGYQTIAELLSFDIQPPISQIMFTQNQSTSPNVFLQKNPRTKDVVIKAKLLVEEHRQNWYYGGHQQIKPGNLIWIFLDNYNLKELEIQHVEEAPPQT